MAVDMFLKLDGIKGEAADSKHKEEIDIDSFTFSVSQQGTNARAGGGGAGKADFKDITFSKRADKSSPPLMLACATGQHIKTAVIVVRKAGSGQQEYYTIKLSDCLVSNFQNVGQKDGDVPVEEFALNYAKIEFEYKPQNADGTLGGVARAGYDVKQNEKVA